ncbi:MAG TPA: chemotaxis protein CheW [Xanthobacteraceae bacterium]|jgi:purine-binding chemotaxis protein CheW
MTTRHESEIEYVTATVGGQLFGAPIARVLDVFAPTRLTRVPLAPPEVAGVLNLRGRIMTAICMRRRLGLPPRENEEKCMALGIERDGEAYGLLVDSVGEVLKLPFADRDAVPVNLQPSWARVATGVHRLEGRILVVLDVDRCLERRSESLAA